MYLVLTLKENDESGFANFTNTPMTNTVALRKEG